MTSAVSSMRHKGTLASFTLAALLGSLPLAAQQQAAPAQQGAPPAAPAQPQQTKVVPALRLQVADKLTEATTCMDDGDTECALKIIADLEKIRDLNNHEKAQIWNVSAFLYFDLDNTAAALDAYEKIVALPQEDLTDGLIQTTTRNLATLYLTEDRLEEGLAMYRQYMALPTVIPNSDDYYLLATIYYQLENYADGLPEIDQAIKLARDKGELGDEDWYILKYVFHYQLEQTNQVIETLTFLVNNFTKRDHVLALAGQLSAQERESETLTLFESAYDAGWLIRGTEWVQLANLYLNGRTPYKAARLLEKGLDEGMIESTQQNWRLLAQAWQLSQEHEKALPALERASRLADDGDVDRLLAQSFASLARWDDCATAARSSIERGGLDRPDNVNMQLGQCLVNLREYPEARRAFEAAARDDRSADGARRWLRYIDDEVARERANAEALASLNLNRN